MNTFKTRFKTSKKYCTSFKSNKHDNICLNAIIYDSGMPEICVLTNKLCVSDSNSQDLKDNNKDFCL
jgi:hypothetical protein